MAGIIGIYGLVVSVLISNDLKQQTALYTGFIQLGAGLSVGLAGLAAGFAIGIVGDAGVRGTAQQPRLFVGMILILIFAEVLGTYPALNLPSNSQLTDSRSVRSHRCSTNELKSKLGRYLLNSSASNDLNSLASLYGSSRRATFGASNINHDSYHQLCHDNNLTHHSA